MAIIERTVKNSGRGAVGYQRVRGLCQSRIATRLAAMLSPLRLIIKFHTRDLKARARPRGDRRL